MNLGYKVLHCELEASVLNADCSGNRVQTPEMVDDLLIEHPGARRASGPTHPPDLPTTGGKGRACLHPH